MLNFQKLCIYGNIVSLKLENYNFESRKNKFRVEITNFAERITNEEVFVQISFDNSEIKKMQNSHCQLAVSVRNKTFKYYPVVYYNFILTVGAALWWFTLRFGRYLHAK